ncbi:hypothetical protein BKA70DRAFT_1566888 [Coprinopsis sp. MPI-PUGE-AT-0042]|nr:hypothetical protein BKA70DRAFT_1566888 [Coprinopsis sp. MPI-PUGE-AT-0042]
MDSIATGALNLGSSCNFFYVSASRLFLNLPLKFCRHTENPVPERNDGSCLRNPQVKRTYVALRDRALPTSTSFNSPRRTLMRSADISATATLNLEGPPRRSWDILFAGYLWIPSVRKIPNNLLSEQLFHTGFNGECRLKMHPCLNIDEVLLEIFREVYEKERAAGPRSVQKSHTVAALARTCKAFRNPALAALWRETFSIARLFNVLPASKIRWEETVHPNGNKLFVMKLADQPTNEEWKTFFDYAARVRHLHLNVQSFRVPGRGLKLVDVDIGVLSAIPDTRIVFPFLQKLELTWEGRGLPLYHLFLSPNIWSLALTFNLKDYDPVLYGFLQKVGSQCKQIQCVSLKNRNHEEYIPRLPLGDIITDVGKVTELSALHVNLSPKTFAIGPDSEGFSNLRVLEIGHPTAKIDRWFPSRMLDYPKLSKLVLISPVGTNLDSVERFFLLCDCPSLEELDVQIFGTTPPERSFRSFFERVAEARNMCSELDRVLVIQRSPDPEAHILERRDMRLTLETLEPLLPLGICDIELDIPSYFALEDSDYHKVADSWFELHHLTFGRPSTLRLQPNATFASFTHFSSLCPYLSLQHTLRAYLHQRRSMEHLDQEPERPQDLIHS